MTATVRLYTQRCIPIQNGQTDELSVRKTVNWDRSCPSCWILQGSSYSLTLSWTQRESMSVACSGSRTNAKIGSPERERRGKNRVGEMHIVGSIRSYVGRMDLQGGVAWVGKHGIMASDVKAMVSDWVVYRELMSRSLPYGVEGRICPHRRSSPQRFDSQDQDVFSLSLFFSALSDDQIS